jgi:hypothetical protein
MWSWCVPCANGCCIKLLHHRHKLIRTIALCSGEGHKLSELLNDGRLLRRPGDDNCSTSTHFNETFVTKKAKGSQHRVCVDVEDSCQVLGLGYSLSGPRFAVSDGSSDFGGDLFVQQSDLSPIDFSKGYERISHWFTYHLTALMKTMILVL